ncbi:hypothetical protein [Rhodopila sp.]|uniref:hypothetical protein n=1 Tax=Rhodopila sp. TaxID=2480087 RepID=UPI003D0FC67B
MNLTSEVTISMAEPSPARSSGPDGLEALTADREKMWNGFTTATTGAVIFMVVLLVLMAVFLL